MEDTPGDLRAKARKCRQLARSINDERAVDALLGLAADYENQASLIEDRTRPPLAD